MWKVTSGEKKVKKRKCHFSIGSEHLQVPLWRIEVQSEGESCSQSKIAKNNTIECLTSELCPFERGGQMITFSNKNHLNKKTKKNDRRWILCFPCKDQKKTPKSKGANQDMALGVEHVYQLWKKAQETAATGCSFRRAYAGWCFGNRDVCFDLESNEIMV